MSFKVLSNELLTELGQRLVVYGFTKKREQTFYRMFDSGWSCVQVGFIKHRDDFGINMDVAIRFDEVEDLVNVVSVHLKDNEKKKTATIGHLLGNLSIGEPLRWTVEGQEDISPAINSMIKAYEKLGEPYLNLFSSMEEAYEVVSRDNRTVGLQCPYDPMRAKTAVAMAYVLKRSDIQDLISTKRKYLQGKKEYELEEFNKFVETLPL